MTDEEVLAWAKQFEMEKGYLPNKDPDLLEKGYSAGQALKEHLDALRYGQDFQKMTGRAPTEHDYRYQWYNGWTPEAIAKGGPDYLVDVAPRQPTAPQLTPAMSARINPSNFMSTSGFGNYLNNRRRVPAAPQGRSF